MTRTLFALLSLCAFAAFVARAQQPAGGAQTPPTATAEEEKWVCVVGGVASPSKVNFKNTLTISGAIKAVGGLTEKKGKVIIYRWLRDGEAEKIQVDFKDVLKGRAEDIELHPYDFIDVPSAKKWRQPAPGQPCRLGGLL